MYGGPERKVHMDLTHGLECEMSDLDMTNVILVQNLRVLKGIQTKGLERKLKVTLFSAITLELFEVEELKFWYDDEHV